MKRLMWTIAKWLAKYSAGVNLDRAIYIGNNAHTIEHQVDCMVGICITGADISLHFSHNGRYAKTIYEEKP